MMKSEKKLIEERRFVRHPARIPMKAYQACETEDDRDTLSNVSLGGLAFESDHAWERGDIIHVQILLVPSFTLTGRVVWCKAKSDNKFDIGIEFVDGNDKDQDQMVDEVCQVETYKKMLEYLAVEWDEPLLLVN